MTYSGWPASGTKPATTSTDADTDSIKASRADIQKAVVALNKIIDIFQLEAEPTDNHIIRYDATSGKFETTADIDTSLSTVGVHDIWIPSQAMYPTTTNGATDIETTEVSATKPEVRFLGFATGADDFAQFSIAMPKSWNEGTITAEFYWTAASGSGGVSWGLQGVCLSEGDAHNTAFGTAVVVDDTLTTANDLHISPTTSAMTLAGSPAAGDIAYFQLFRDTDDSNDTLGVDAKLIGVKLHYTTEAETDA